MSKEVVIFDSREKLEEVLELNQIRQIRINNEPYNIVRTPNQVVIFEEKCPHMDYPLNKGHINGYGEVACPWHGYRYDLVTGEESSRKCRPLHVIHTKWNESGQLVMVI